MTGFPRGVWARSALLAAFFGAGLAVYAFIYTNIGGYIPFVTSSEYTSSVELTDADNIVTAGLVSTAGVRIGEVRSVERVDGAMKVVFALDRRYAPLHQGVRVRLGERSLVGESYLDVVDGTGSPLPSGVALPRDAVQPSTQLRDVLASLDQATRADMGAMLRSVGAGTEGTQQPVSAMFTGLGDLGRGGTTALTALAAQSDDLRKLGQETATLLDALDTGQGQIADLVSGAQRLTQASAGQREAVADSMRQLPGVLDTANEASAGLVRLAGALAPVAADLKRAGPDLSDALRQLPNTTSDLRGLLPALDGTLDHAPATLERTDRFSKDVREAAGPANEILRDLVPMLRYIKPYGPDLTAYLANFNGILQHRDEMGVHYVRLMPVVDERSVQTPLPYSVLTYTNALPKPGSLPNPGPFTGAYPRVERLPR